jgi:membrane fusion protein, multidrug efflux system
MIAIFRISRLEVVMRARNWAATGVSLFCLVGCGDSRPPLSQVRPVRSVVVEHKVRGELIAFTGQIKAQDEASLAFRIDGKLVERLVSIGDHVEAGQLIARLNPQEEQNSLDDAQANLAAAQAALTQAQRVEERQRELLAKGFASRSQYDATLQQLQSAQAQLDSAQLRVQRSRNRVGFSELRADAPGTVIAKGADPGEVVRTGQMIVQLARQGGRDALFNVPAQLIRQTPRDPLVEIALVDNPAVRTTRPRGRSSGRSGDADLRGEGWPFGSPGGDVPRGDGDREYHA